MSRWIVRTHAGRPGWLARVACVGLVLFCPALAGPRRAAMGAIAHSSVGTATGPQHGPAGLVVFGHVGAFGAGRSGGGGFALIGGVPGEMTSVPASSARVWKGYD